MVALCSTLPDSKGFLSSWADRAVVILEGEHQDVRENELCGRGLAESLNQARPSSWDAGFSNRRVFCEALLLNSELC